MIFIKQKTNIDVEEDFFSSTIQNQTNSLTNVFEEITINIFIFEKFRKKQIRHNQIKASTTFFETNVTSVQDPLTEKQILKNKLKIVFAKKKYAQLHVKLFEIEIEKRTNFFLSILFIETNKKIKKNFQKKNCTTILNSNCMSRKINMF